MNNPTIKIVKSSDISVIFMGTSEFAVPILLKLFSEGFRIVAVVTQPDKPSGRHLTLTPSPVKEAALSLSIPVLQPISLRTQEFETSIMKLTPDIIVTAAYGKLLPKKIIEIPKFCINVHASILPKYRGASPIQHCLFNGDELTGVTIMEMDEGLDTGAIIFCDTMRIPGDMNAGELTASLSEIGANCIAPVILGYVNGQITATAQDSAFATNVKPITKADGEINWNMTATDIHNLVRGCYPWPCAYTFNGSKRMKISKTKVFNELPLSSQEYHISKTPGDIIRSEDKTRLFVVCGEGFIELIELQIEGCKSLSAINCAHNIAQFTHLGG